MLKMGSFVIHCRDFDQTVAFWQDALGYEPRSPAGEDWVVLKDPGGTLPNVSVQGTEELHFGRNRMHLDLYASDREAEVARLVSLGATVHRPALAGEDFVILADPEGKLFCVVQAPPGKAGNPAGGESE